MVKYGVKKNLAYGLAFDMTESEIEALEKRVERDLLRKAVNQRVVSKPGDAVVRDLLPSDLNSVSGETWVEPCTAGAYSTVFSGRLSNPDRLITIYGIGDGYETNVSNAAAISTSGAVRSIPPGKTLRFGLGAGPTSFKDIWNIDRMRAAGKDHAFANKVIEYNKNDTFAIQVKGEFTADDHVVLFGKICEGKGVTITGGS